VAVSDVCTHCGKPPQDENRYCGCCGAPLSRFTPWSGLPPRECLLLAVALLLLCGLTAPLGLPWYVGVGSFALAALPASKAGLK
jgi:hypothetical protein